MQITPLFAITYNSDLAEGRGHKVILGYARTKQMAEAIVSDERFSRYCCMGHHNGRECIKYNIEEKDVFIFESVDDLYNLEDLKIRKQALAKLTPKERKVLGLE